MSVAGPDEARPGGNTMTIARRSEFTSPSHLDPFRVMRDALGWPSYPDHTPLSAFTATSNGGFSPSFEVRETNEAIEIRADLPGMQESDIDVSISGNRLTISGQREHEKKDERANYYVVERSFGKFRRTFGLPDGMDTDKVAAHLDAGVLTLKVPKIPKSETKKVVIGSGANTNAQ